MYILDDREESYAVFGAARVHGVDGYHDEDRSAAGQNVEYVDLAKVLVAVHQKLAVENEDVGPGLVQRFKLVQNYWCQG